MAHLIALQMDPPDTLNPATDSSLYLALEAQRRGYRLIWYHPSTLRAENGHILANGYPLTVYDRAENFYEQGSLETMDLEQADFVLIRQDPPYNMPYLMTTWLLELLQHPVVLNRPVALRNLPEKLFPLQFPSFCPPTLITSDRNALHAFRAEHQDIVLKPLFGFGGEGVQLVKHDNPHFGHILDSYFTAAPEPLVAQPFLPLVSTQEKRILLVNGEIGAAFGRIPAEGDIRSNLRVGGTAIATELTPRQRDIAQTVGTRCKREGILLAGLDVIGDWLIEINITSPTGLRAAEKITGNNLAVPFWNAAEAMLKEKHAA
jgi:glutathione synthase